MSGERESGKRPESPRHSGPPLLSAWEGRSAEAWARRLSVATVEFHARIGSTNDRARALVQEGWPAPAVVLADRQSAGKGRRGRRWVSDTPLGLWFTVVRQVGPADTGALPLRVGLAAARAVESIAPELGIQVKWPNDLFANGRKVGGVLCERAGGMVLAGVGLNLNQSRGDLPGGLTPPATSILLEGGHPVARSRVLARVMDALEAVWARPGPSIPPTELAALEARSPLSERRLSIDGVVRHPSEGPRTVEGLSATAGSLRSDGSLEIRDDGGTRLRLIAGSIGWNSHTPGS